MLNCIVISALSVPASALAPVQILYDGIQSQAPWPSSISNGADFERLEAGELDDELGPDLVVLQGERLSVAVNPEREGRHIELANGVSDFALIREAAASGGDLVLYADLEGLWTREWNAAAGQFHAPVSLGGTAWVGVKLSVTSVPSIATPTVTALLPDQKTNLSYLFSNGALTNGYTRVNSATISSIEPLDWTGNGVLEFALAESAGIRIVNPMGSSLSFVPSTGTDHRLERMPGMYSGGGERLAWIHEEAGTGDGLLSVLHSVLGAEPFLFLGESGAEHVTLGCIDGDEHADLILTRASSFSMQVVRYTRHVEPVAPSSFSVVGGATIELNGGSTATPAFAPVPTVADFDSDWDDDVMLGYGAPLQLEFVRGDAVNEDGRMIRFADPGATYSTWLAPGNLQMASFEFDIEAMSLGGSVLGATAVEARIWRKSGLGELANSVPVVDQLLVPPTGFDEDWSVGLSFLREGHPGTTIYMLQFALVTQSGAQIVSRGPTITGYYSADVATMEIIEDNVNAWEASGTGPDPGDEVPPLERRPDASPFETTP